MSEEYFSLEQVGYAINQFLDYGEKSLGKCHQGYFSGIGWASRCLTHYLKELDKFSKILNIMILLIAKLSLHDMERLLGEKDAKTLNDWYYESRDKY